jgi:23S rRNA (cytosine1962-C5)-methyltransferase
MKKMYPIVHIDPRRLATIQKIHHPWIFSRAIIHTDLPKKELNGRLVSVLCNNEFVCHGYFNEHSQIAVRILSWNKNEKIDQHFFENRIKEALVVRKAFVLNEQTNACRLIFSESDGLPGFIIDNYNNSFVIQISTLGADSLKQTCVDALISVCKPIMIYEKSSGDARSKEGLPSKHSELLYGEKVSKIIIMENNIKYSVDVEAGQKTGFFLDQRDNRERVISLSSKRRVLNMCAYTGGFSLSALQGGASFVHSVDISENAIAQLRENCKLNNIDAKLHEETVADAFDFLKTVKPGSYDLIILDPPAFVKSQKDLTSGMKAYTMLNSLALQALPREGILCTSSCSGAISSEQFSNILTWASRNADCDLQILGKFGHAVDHPLLPNFPEAQYLKFFVCIINKLR